MKNESAPKSHVSPALSSISTYDYLLHFWNICFHFKSTISSSIILGNDGWRLKFSQNNKKILEIYFGKDEEKCKNWYDMIKEIKSPIKKSKTMKIINRDSFQPLKGLDEDTKDETLANNETKPIQKIEEKKVEVADSSTQSCFDRKEFGMNTYVPKYSDALTETTPKYHANLSTNTTQTLTKEAEVNTIPKELVERGVSTKHKKLVDSSVNTNQIDFIDAQESEAIAKQCWSLMMQEKELEIALNIKKDEVEIPPTFSRMFSDIIPEDRLDFISKLKEKYYSFEDWNLESVDNQLLVYSSKTPQQIIQQKNQFKNQLADATSEIRNIGQMSRVISNTLEANKKVAVWLLLLVIYISSRTLGLTVMSESVLCILVPIMLITSISIAQMSSKNEIENKQTKIKDCTSMFKITSKFWGAPDDLAIALSRRDHRKKWDMDIIDIFQSESPMTPIHEINIQYASHLEGSISEAIFYDYYQESEDMYYILEDSVIDRFSGEHSNRLFWLERCFDASDNVYYSLSVYGELKPHVLNHKSEQGYKVDYIKALLVYTQSSWSMPSAQKPKLMQPDSPQWIDSDTDKNEGRIRFSFKKVNQSLEQINESAEFKTDEDDIEEFKMSQLYMKDTLLTIDEFNSMDGDSHELDSNLVDETSEEASHLLRTESDDLSQIMFEAIAYDKRVERFVSKDSIDPTNWPLDNQILGKAISEGSEWAESLVDSKKTPLSLNADSVANIEAPNACRINLTAPNVSTEPDAIKNVCETIKQEKDTTGAVASPFKKSVSSPNPMLGVSTIDLDWKPNRIK